MIPFLSVEQDRGIGELTQTADVVEVQVGEDDGVGSEVAG
jgi:hypothetical protein